MQLKPEILDVLAKLGATDPELASLTSYFADQLTAAESAVAQIHANIESLQKQLGEETARAERIRAGIGKFVASE